MGSRGFRILSYAALICYFLVVPAILCWHDATHYNPAFGVYPTTWEGYPAYGQLDERGWYTFYHWTPTGAGPPIASFPAGEAMYLH